MPSKFRKAIGAVKDQTSISIAKVYTNNGTKSNIEVIVLKATRHDEVPVDDRYVKELLNLIYSNKVHAAACAQVIGKRIGKTRNWIVALKSLMLVFRILQDGDPYFPREIHHAMKRGAKILNLSTFRDDSHSSPWDYTAFVRTFALYLDERLDCFLKSKLRGKFSKRYTHHQTHIYEMKPTVLVDKICYWQKLLDRAMGTRPTGSAKTSKLLKISLYAVAEESFDLYRDISDGLALLLDSFFHLQYELCVSSFQLCVKASKQFEELSSFYDMCKSIGVGRTSEYPSVQKISEELIETLKEFLKDQASFPTHHGDRFSEGGSEIRSYHSNSLEDLMSSTDVGTSRSTSVDCYIEQLGSETATEQGTLSGANSNLDLVSLEDWPPEGAKEQEQGNCWEIVLAETANQESENALSNSLFDQVSMPERKYNPFLEDNLDMPVLEMNEDDMQIVAITSNDQRVFPLDDLFAVTPTFQANPTFSAKEHEDQTPASPILTEDDPFAPTDTQQFTTGFKDQQILMHEQQLWLQNQDKIIAKNMA